MHTSFLPTGQRSRLKEVIRMQISSDRSPSLGACNYQEPITWSLQLPHIPVTAFAQTYLFLV